MRTIQIGDNLRKKILKLDFDKMTDDKLIELGDYVPIEDYAHKIIFAKSSDVEFNGYGVCTVNGTAYILYNGSSSNRYHYCIYLVKDGAPEPIFSFVIDKTDNEIEINTSLDRISFDDTEDIPINYVDSENPAYNYILLEHSTVYAICEDLCMEETMTKEQINKGLSGKSDTTHTHDDRYYTKAESDAKYIFKNHFATVSGAITYGDTPQVTTIDYPSGFTKNNSIVVSYDFMGYYFKDGISILLDSSNIQVITSSGSSGAGMGPINITLMKIS